MLSFTSIGDSLTNFSRLIFSVVADCIFILDGDFSEKHENKNEKPGKLRKCRKDIARDKAHRKGTQKWWQQSLIEKKVSQKAILTQISCENFVFIFHC